jgi:hypothetical protein
MIWKLWAVALLASAAFHDCGAAVHELSGIEHDEGAVARAFHSSGEELQSVLRDTPFLLTAPRRTLEQGAARIAREFPAGNETEEQNFIEFVTCSVIQFQVENDGDDPTPESVQSFMQGKRAEFFLEETPIGAAVDIIQLAHDVQSGETDQVLGALVFQACTRA